MSTPGPVTAWPIVKVRIPPTLLRAVESRAADCGLPVADVFRELCEVGLSKERCQHRLPAAAPVEDDADEDEGSE